MAKCEECGKRRPVLIAAEVGIGYGPRRQVRLCKKCLREHEEAHTGFAVA